MHDKSPEALKVEMSVSVTTMINESKFLFQSWVIHISSHSICPREFQDEFRILTHTHFDVSFNVFNLPYFFQKVPSKKFKMKT